MAWKVTILKAGDEAEYEGVFRTREAADVYAGNDWAELGATSVEVREVDGEGFRAVEFQLTPHEMGLLVGALRRAHPQSLNEELGAEFDAIDDKLTAAGAEVAP